MNNECVLTIFMSFVNDIVLGMTSISRINYKWDSETMMTKTDNTKGENLRCHESKCMCIDTETRQWNSVGENTRNAAYIHEPGVTVLHRYMNWRKKKAYVVEPSSVACLHNLHSATTSTQHPTIILRATLVTTPNITCPAHTCMHIHDMQSTMRSPTHIQACDTHAYSNVLPIIFGCIIYHTTIIWHNKW